MPNYIFKSEKNEVKEFYFPMNLVPSIGGKYFYENQDWTRIPTLPQTNIDSNIDPFNERTFLEKTSKNDTIGSLYDRSKEMSQKREKILGKDPIKEKYIEKAAKKRKGKDLISE